MRAAGALSARARPRRPRAAYCGLPTLSARTRTLLTRLSSLSRLASLSGLSGSGRARRRTPGAGRAGGGADTGNGRNRPGRNGTRHWPGPCRASATTRRRTTVARDRGRGRRNLTGRRNTTGNAVTGNRRRTTLATAAVASPLIPAASRGRGTPVHGPLALPSRLRRVAGKRFLEPSNDRRLDRRGRRTHKLAHFFELGHDSLTLYAELLREFVNPDLRHYAPLLARRRGLKYRIISRSGA